MNINWLNLLNINYIDFYLIKNIDYNLQIKYKKINLIKKLKLE